MTDRLAKLLADTNDPDVIRELLEFAADTERSDTSSVALDSLSSYFDQFLSRRRDRSPATRSQYKRTIPRFIEFANRNNVTTPTELTPELVDTYVDALHEHHNSDATILTHTKNVRGWLRWLNKRGYCPERIYRLLDADELGLNPSARDDALTVTMAETILSKLRTQRRGSLTHTLLEILWNTGARIGGLHSLDVPDYDSDRNELRLRHRPDQGTRLKNGNQNDGHGGDGERNILLNKPASHALSLYITYERPDITDEDGREPLFATQYGRAGRSTLRRTIYDATSCRWHTPEETDVDCDGECHPDTNVCPYSYNPHAIRRGSIVHHLSGGLRLDLASERFDVSIQTLRQHYDPRSKRRQREDRAQSVRDAW